MKPKDFHLALTEIIDLLECFPKTFRIMLVAPSTGFAEALTPGATPKMLPGVFLFLNLFIADLVTGTGLYLPTELRQWSLQAVKEIPSHISGTLIFLFILKLSFRKVKTTDLFTIICLSSIVYLPFAAVMLAFRLIIGPSFSNFLIFALSRQYQTVGELLAPLIPICHKLIPLLIILTIIFVWWLRLLSLGCGQVVPISRRKRFQKLGQSILIYIMVFIIAMAVVLGTTIFSMIRGLSNYEKMRNSFEKGNYAQAFFLALDVSNNEKLPPVGRYRAYLIRGVSQMKTFLKSDDTFRDAIIAINANKYRDAEIIMRREVERQLLSMTSPMRLTFKDVETALSEAAKQYDSPLYSEAPMNIYLLVFPRHIPINMFPRF